MNVIVFNDIKNFDGCLNFINDGLPEGKKRFWDINKYVPFLVEKIKKEKFSNEELKLVKILVYSGRYNSKLITSIKWSCNNKIQELQGIINKEKLLLEEISKHKLDKELNNKILAHVNNIIEVFDQRKQFYIDRINKQIRNRIGQNSFFEKYGGLRYLFEKYWRLKQIFGAV